MWHWNSWWARAPGDPPTVDDPVLWQTPWTLEQSLALQTRMWETMLSTGHSFWTAWLAAWPAASWPLPGVAPANESNVPALPFARAANDNKAPAAARKRPTQRSRSKR